MEQLFYDRHTRIFIFKDDDLGLKDPGQKQWVEDFAQELKRRGISDKIAWRISCRVDEVDAEILSILKDVGLVFLYLGIESGNDQGLRIFNKRYTINQIHRSLAILQELGIHLSYGFMMLDPDSTIDSVKENVAFLEEMTRDGQAAVNFTKMFPYAGTTIARKLKKEGRLKGTVTSPEYDFKDPRLGMVEYFLLKALSSYLSGNGLADRLGFARFDAVILDKFFSDKCDTKAYDDAIRGLVQQSNNSVIDTMNRGIRLVEKMSYEEICSEGGALESIIKEEMAMEQRIGGSLEELMARYSSYTM